MGLAVELISVACPINNETLKNCFLWEKLSAQSLNASKLISRVFVMGTVAGVAWRWFERRMENISASSVGLNWFKKSTEWTKCALIGFAPARQKFSNRPREAQASSLRHSCHRIKCKFPVVAHRYERHFWNDNEVFFPTLIDSCVGTTWNRKEEWRRPKTRKDYQMGVRWLKANPNLDDKWFCWPRHAIAQSSLSTR